jgi:kelch-like protein 2/3
MEQVRFPLLSQEYLVHRVDEEPLLQLSPKCKDLLIEALKFHLLRGEQKATFASPRTKPRQPVGLPKVLLVVGGQAPKAIRCVESYDFKVGMFLHYSIHIMTCFESQIFIFDNVNSNIC